MTSVSRSSSSVLLFALVSLVVLTYPPSSVAQVARSAKPSKFYAKKHNVDADQAAKSSLDALKRLINAENAKNFGLETAEQVGALRLGEPVTLFYVRADQLQDYKGDTDAGRLLLATNRKLYPVELNGTGKLIITVEKQSSGWRAVSIGDQDIAPSLTRIKRDKLTKIESGPGAVADDYFAVQVPAMHLTFLGYAPPPAPGGSEEQKTKVMLTPLDSKQRIESTSAFTTHFLLLNPSFSAEGKASKSANTVFKALAPNAASVLKGDAPH